MYGYWGFPWGDGSGVIRGCTRGCAHTYWAYWGLCVSSWGGGVLGWGEGVGLGRDGKLCDLAKIRIII